MNKEGLTEDICKKTGITKKDSKNMINAFIESIKETVAKNESVTLSGFGTFSLQHRKEKRTTNPRTHEPMIIKDRNVVKFEAGLDFKNRINHEV